MDRILIIGLNGSGKSTFANKLGKKLNREVIHLDKVYYNSGWQRAQTREEWKELVRNLVIEDRWIMDGQFTSTLDIRIPRATTIIFLDFNKLLCLYRVVRRLFNRNQPFDKAKGNKERISWNLIEKIIRFPKKKVLEKLEPYKDTKKIYILKNDKEVEELLNQLN